VDRLEAAPNDGEAYRFEIGGGHWIFGGDPAVGRFIRSLGPVRSYERQSSVYFPEEKRFAPYPIQNHLRFLGAELAAKALSEMVEAPRASNPAWTMAEWLRAYFGAALCERFFDPFHELYTAGLWKSIAPQDAYKSPVNLGLAAQGALRETPAAGYNAAFVYPVEGLDALARRMASKVRVQYGKKAVAIDLKRKEAHFADGSAVRYKTLISTLPLSQAIELAGLRTEAKPDPYTSVLVANIGARKGRACPADHWVYAPRSKAGFHRVGFYSNVDPSFLPASARKARDRVSIYVETAFPAGKRPSKAQSKALCGRIVKELQEWDWIGEAETVSPTWIDVAYTWSWPKSRWKDQALRALEEHAVWQVGRYGRWIFQGIADSIRDGFIAGAALGAGRP
jgi:protoporphyrinogen oxidase